jgi:hypothetical protein
MVNSVCAKYVIGRRMNWAIVQNGVRMDLRARNSAMKGQHR